MIIGARGAYHYNDISSVPKLDVYGGEMVRYFSDGDDMSIGNSYGIGVGISGFLGSRWFFSDKIGAHT
ncbi:hypothetical protein [Sphingobacterium sp.]|uniref:hypothetical protein n=1 Tax=Sphingobacterium sp. TaxID=341027 RepID=UPI0028A76D21|nr:hypothetical protein [Sphingobacterium sp.]